MHIPDGFVNIDVSAATAVLSAGGLGASIAVLNKRLQPSRVPLMGLSAAFIFAAQMLNFPVMGGTSGHLLGAALVAMLLGPAAATVVMSSVVILQCLIFGDGGLVSLGANLFNMAIVAPWTAYLVFSVFRRIAGLGTRARVATAAFGAWCSIVAASFACAIELSVSGSAPAGIVVPAMLFVHMVIGAAEALVTASAIYFLSRHKPELFGVKPKVEATAGRRFAWAGITAGVLLLVINTPLASTLPDGLESVAESLGFAEKSAEAAPATAIMAGYTIPGFINEYLATILAAAVGTMLAFALSLVLARVLVAPAKDKRAINR